MAKSKRSIKITFEMGVDGVVIGLKVDPEIRQEVKEAIAAEDMEAQQNIPAVELCQAQVLLGINTMLNDRMDEF